MPDLLKFFNDPDFHYVIEMLSKNAERIDDISTIDLNQSAETIKAQVAGRQQVKDFLNNFIQDVNTYKNKNIINDNPPTFK